MHTSLVNTQFKNGMPEKKANRVGFGEGLLEAGKRNPEVVALCADLTDSTRVINFAEAFPERFVQVGVAEQNMASVASGMAMMGKIPFIASYAMFSPGRNWEQIRTTIAYNDANVKIIGAHAGISVGPDGATHQAIEDIAITRVMPNMTVLAPIDVHEARKATIWAAEHQGPVYLRLSRNDTPIITTEDAPFIVGKAECLFNDTEGDLDAAILTTGTIGAEALRAAANLTEAGYRVSVHHFGTVKPLDTDTLQRVAARARIVVTVEEHQIAGGFGSVVCEYLAATAPTFVLRIGINDRFGQSGEPEELLREYECDAQAIFEKTETLLSQLES